MAIRFDFVGWRGKFTSLVAVVLSGNLVLFSFNSVGEPWVIMPTCFVLIILIRIFAAFQVALNHAVSYLQVDPGSLVWVS